MGRREITPKDMMPRARAFDRGAWCIQYVVKCIYIVENKNTSTGRQTPNWTVQHKRDGPVDGTKYGTRV